MRRTPAIERSRLRPYFSVMVRVFWTWPSSGSCTENDVM
jgi:hypothetical protein